MQENARVAAIEKKTGEGERGGGFTASVNLGILCKFWEIRTAVLYIYYSLILCQVHLNCNVKLCFNEGVINFVHINSSKLDLLWKVIKSKH